MSLRVIVRVSRASNLWEGGHPIPPEIFPSKPLQTPPHKKLPYPALFSRNMTPNHKEILYVQFGQSVALVDKEYQSSKEADNPKQ